MQCPQCGYRRQAEDDAFVPRNECPACGIVDGDPDALAPPSGPIRKPSPVSASSLRKARERVEQRLREQQLARRQDSRHDQTLELARRLASEGIQKRRAEWEKKQKEKEDKAAVATTPSAHAHPEKKTVIDPAVELPKPDRNRKQSGKTIAKALDRKEKEPGHMPDAASNRSSDSPPDASDPRDAWQNKRDADKPHDGAAGDQNIETETPQSVVATATESGEPIPLFQNKPVAPNTGKQAPPSLKAMLEDMEPSLLASASPESSRPSQRRPPQHGLTRLLPIVAWLILVAGVIGAILSWTTIGEVEAGMKMPESSPLSLLLLGLLLGFAYLATGVLGFAFFWVSSLINNQLKDMRRLLLKQPAGQIDPKQAGAPEPKDQFMVSD